MTITTPHINLVATLTVDNTDFSGKVGEAASTNRTRVFLRPADQEASDELSSWHLGKIVETTDVIDQVEKLLDIDLSEDGGFKIKARDKDGYLPFLIIQGHEGRTLAFDVEVTNSETVTEIEDPVDEVDEADEVIETEVTNEVEAPVAEAVEAE